MEKKRNEEQTELLLSQSLYLYSFNVGLDGLDTLTIAHSPPVNIPTFSFCSVSPNPIGVGQSVNVNFWVGQPPPTASGQFGDRWANLTVIVTKPDGNKETLGPFTSDATGGSHTTYTPTASR